MTLGDMTIRYPRGVSWFVLMGALAIIIAAMTMAVYEESLYQSQRVQEVREQSDILAATVKAALSFDDKHAAAQYANSMRVNPELEAVGIYTSAGELFAGFARKGAAGLPAHVAVAGLREQKDRLIAVTPVLEQGKQIGLVYVRAIAEPAKKRLTRYAVLALLAVMAGLMLLVLGGSQAGLSRANRALEERSEALAAANARLHSEMAERERIEEALRQSQKMEAIGQLSGGIAHDFNNLLTIIKGNLQRLERKLKEGSGDVPRHIAAAMEGVNRAAVLTQRILAFSRKQTLDPQPVDANALIRGMDELIRNSVRENIAVEQELKASWLAVCDPNQLENVLLNLIINSRDAMPLGGTLWIRTEDVRLAEWTEEAPPGDYVRLTVRDNGMGMPEEVRAKALDPFFTTKPPGQGTGLGLSMIFGFARQSGGDMTIDSKPGEGTVVTILLPRETPLEESRSAA